MYSSGGSRWLWVGYGVSLAKKIGGAGGSFVECLDHLELGCDLLWGVPGRHSFGLLYCGCIGGNGMAVNVEPHVQGDFSSNLEQSGMALCHPRKNV